jgi:recombinational DNA repair protein (RecF pathway)
MNSQNFCIFCKEFADKRYEFNVSDKSDSVNIAGFLCRHCWDRFTASHNNDRLFKVSQFLGWIKERKDIFRH